MFTTGPRDAAAIAAREATAGRRLILALGGDGTISEVADGVLSAGAGGDDRDRPHPARHGRRLPPHARAARGVGAAARHIRDAAARVIDAGRVHYRAHDGTDAVRHFINVASFGFSSAVATRANASSKRLGGKIAFIAATLRVLIAHENTDVWLSIDGGPRQRRRLLLAAVGNGRFFGGGMKICPEARLDDGALDLVMVGDYSRMEVMTRISHLYAGTHLELEEIEGARVTRLVVEPVEADAGFPSSSTARPRAPPGDVRDPAGGAAPAGLTRVGRDARRTVSRTRAQTEKGRR